MYNRKRFYELINDLAAMNELEYKVVGIPKEYDFQRIISEQNTEGYIPIFHINNTNYHYNGGHIVFKKKEVKKSKWELFKQLLTL